ncbi:MAG: glycosyltransferase family 4 protein [Anaerolineae bacterium]
MNIVMIGPFGLRPKSTMRERAVPLAGALAARGHRVTVLIPPWDYPSDSGQSREEAGVRVVNVALPPRVPLLFHLWLTWRLVRAALALRPEVIHLFKPKAYAGLSHLLLWGLRRWGRHRARLVVDEDDWEAAWNQVEAYSWAQRQMFAWQEPWGLRHADAVTVASQALRELVAGLGVPAGEIFYVPNGMRHLDGDAAVSRVLERHGLNSKPVILLYTRFVEFKVESLVESIQLMAGRAPQARWLIVGRGLLGEEEQLARLLAREALSERVEFAGWVPGEELPAYFAAATVAVQPFADTLINRTKCSVKLIDLLAAGVPVVASAIGQNQEYIDHNETGLLVPPGDAEQLVEVTAQLLADRPRRQRLGAAAARRMRDRFAWGRLAETVEDAYRCR